MEKKLIGKLDNLTIEQTEKLLNANIKMKIKNKDRKRIKKSVFEKSGLNQNRKIYILRKIAVCAAAFAVIFISLSLIGFNNIAAAIGKLFTFIPGVGITEKSDTLIYSIDPIVGYTEYQDAKANIIRAIYVNDYLTVTVEVDGKELYHEDFSFFINQKQADYNKESSANLAVSSDSSMLSFSYKTEAPQSDDIYEIAVTGFSEHLSFKMIPCSEYDDIKKIGPSEIQNGISITADAQRINDQLIIWCYPFRTDNTTKDKIVGYGLPVNASYNEERYIVTESGKIFENGSGWHISERFIFDIAYDDCKAALHIPYLSMLRSEKKKLKINLPKDYTAADSDISMDCTLGKIKVTEIKRVKNEYEEDKDTVWLKFEFESNDSTMILNSFDFETAGKYLSGAMHFNPGNGSLEYLEVDVDKNARNISLNITDIYYYLMGEYVIPLDIQ